LNPKGVISAEGTDTPRQDLMGYKKSLDTEIGILLELAQIAGTASDKSLDKEKQNHVDPE